MDYDTARESLLDVLPHGLEPEPSTMLVSLTYLCECTAITIAVTAYQHDLAYWADVYCCRCREKIDTVDGLLTVDHFA